MANTPTFKPSPGFQNTVDPITRNSSTGRLMLWSFLIVVALLAVFWAIVRNSDRAGHDDLNTEGATAGRHRTSER